jgi:N6-adenosine-specific RNA methylase IME4
LKKLELYARQENPGFDSWGNEIKPKMEEINNVQM